MIEKPMKMLTVKEVSEILHVHPSTVRSWCDQGMLKTHRIGPRGDRRFRPEDIDNFLHLGRTDTEGEGAVLIVDDDSQVSKLVKDIVEGQGYEVRCCGTGEQALEEIADQSFDLVFLDLVLPGINGLEVLRTIKEREDSTVVAVITGYGDDPIALEAMNMGPMFFIRKPFDRPTIIKVLDVVMKANR
jgi:excisionase family DNA binding protein